MLTVVELRVGRTDTGLAIILDCQYRKDKQENERQKRWNMDFTYTYIQQMTAEARTRLFSNLIITVF